MSKLKARKPESTSPGKAKIVLFGAPKVGKTWFALSFPKPFYFDSEGGAKLGHYQERLKEVGGGYLGPEDGTLDFEFLIDQIKALATEKHEYKTLVVDSVTKLYQTAISNEAEKLGEKDAFGASKKPAIREMRRLVNWVMRLDMNVIFIAHEMPEWSVNEKSGQREETGKVADTWPKLAYEIDLTLHASKAGASRIARVFHSRLTGFKDNERFPMEYKEFANRYGKDFIDGAPTQIKMADPARTAELQRLIELLRITPAEIDKWLEKAKADALSDMSEEVTEKCIEALNKKIEKQ